MKKKIAIITTLAVLLVSGVADAGIRLRGKSIYDVHKFITCASGVNEQVIGDKIKISTMSPITGVDYSGKIGVRPSDPNSDMYYFRVSGIGHADNVYGIKGVSLRMENSPFKIMRSSSTIMMFGVSEVSFAALSR